MPYFAVRCRKASDAYTICNRTYVHLPSHHHYPSYVRGPKNLSNLRPELDNKRPLLWRELAKQIPGRSNKDCRKRWWNSLAGSTAKGAWSPEEDRRLIEAVEKYGTNWMKVAGAVGTRCGDQCSGHWRHVLNPNINYCDWTTEEVSRVGRGLTSRLVCDAGTLA